MKHHPATQKRTNCRASIEMCPLIGFKIAFPPGHFTIPTEQEQKKSGETLVPGTTLAKCFIDWLGELELGLL